MLRNSICFKLKFAGLFGNSDRNSNKLNIPPKKEDYNKFTDRFIASRPDRITKNNHYTSDFSYIAMVNDDHTAKIYNKITTKTLWSGFHYYNK